MRIDAAGLKLIADHEGLRTKAYQDSGGVWTIGYGHTATAKRGMKISKETALRLLEQDIRRFEQCVEDAVRVPLTQRQFNALVSLAFNRGCGGFKNAKVLDALNNADFEGAARLWLTTAVTVNGKRLGGLVRRRRNEVAHFLEGGSPRPDMAMGRWLFFGSIKGVLGRAG
ncbi:MAG: lysozyme [Candidatus Kapabacteria bacterium]|nr:lysozyme [Candidatus Kapabacteria bacterium]